MLKQKLFNEMHVSVVIALNSKVDKIHAFVRDNIFIGFVCWKVRTSSFCEFVTVLFSELGRCHIRQFFPK